MSFDHKTQDKCDNCANQFGNLFCQPDNDRIEGLRAQKICSIYRKGEYIFKEGSIPYGVYCVNFGKVKLTKMGLDGKDQIIRLVKPGDPLGYRSLLSNDRYNASAIALEDSGVCFIPKDLFMGVIQKDSTLTMEMFKLLSEDLKKADIQLTHIAQKPVRERVAEALLFIKETYGYEADGSTISAKISREDIANIVGTATETAIRILSDFNKEGVISLKGKKIEIANSSKLLKIANIQD